MRIAYPLSCFAALACITTQAISAETPLNFAELSGKVLISSPEGLVPAQIGQPILEGAQVFVGEEAIARVATADGTCNVNLPTRKITQISRKKICGEIAITPTASNPPIGGVPPAVIGLGFFASVLVTAGVAEASNDDSVSLP